MSGAPALPPGWKNWPEEQLATLVQTSLQQHVNGIPPGEKLHETMIPADESHSTEEL